MPMNDDELHLLFLGHSVGDNGTSTESEDEPIEIVSNVDENQNEIIDMKIHFLIQNGPENQVPNIGAIAP